MKVNVFNNVWQAYNHPGDVADVTFQELVLELMTSQKCLDNKEDGQLFNVYSTVVDFSPPGNEETDYSPYKRTDLIRRCKENVDTIFCLLLDVDGTLTLDEAIAEWQDYEFFVYSSFNHSTDKDKFRLIVPLKTPLTASEFNERHLAMVQRFNVDGASFTISQCFYFPSFSTANKDIAFMYYNEGKRFDATPLSAVPVVKNDLTGYSPPTEKTVMGEIIYQTFMTGSDLHFVDALPLAVICKAHGIGFSDFRNIIIKASAKTSCLRDKHTKIQELYNKGYVTHVTTAKTVQLMKQIGCNTWRFDLSGGHNDKR